MCFITVSAKRESPSCKHALVQDIESLMETCETLKEMCLTFLKIPKSEKNVKFAVWKTVKRNICV